MIQNKLNKYLLSLSLILLSVSAFADDKPISPKQNGIKLDSNITRLQDTIEQDNDSLSNNNIILNAVWIPEQIKVTLSLQKVDQPIRIVIYNMLAKPVKSKDINAGEIFNNTEYIFDNTFDLPQGYYFCVLIGNGFQDTKKITITR
ncbi:hypothetical protein OAQ99_00040 [Candidatus Kapabacteria bacterium]|nr:hypothetical protein [Candidatus Kapabacteria bacterium]